MPEPLSPDANPEVASSTTSPDANTAAASSPAPDAKPPVSFADASPEDISKVIPLAEPKPTATESSTVPTGSTAVEKPPAGEIIKSNPTGEPKPPTEFANLPFHEHEDFKKLVKERNTLRDFETVAKPSVERLKIIDDWTHQNSISPEQFKNGMEILALINTNPAEALKRLQPTLEQLQKYQGTVLPPDLQAEVDSGKLMLEHAQRIARAEHQRQFDTQRQLQSEATQRASSVATALNQWENNMLTKDLEYSKKQSLVNARFVALSAENKWQTSEQAIALAQRAYEEVNTAIAGFIPKPKPTKVLESNGSTVSLTPDVTWDKVEDHIVSQLARG